MIVKAIKLYDGYTLSKDKYIEIEDNKIVNISEEKRDYDFEGIITPAFIDAHSHIGMYREGEPSSEGEGNDKIDQIQPINEPLNSVYMDDVAFESCVDFGVLYSCIVPGSGNLIGGKATIIRNFAKDTQSAFFKSYGYKMALGYNPMSTTRWKGKRPTTRMGVYAQLEKSFDDLIQKWKKAELSRDKKLYELEKKELSSENFELEKRFIEEEYNLTFSNHDQELLTIISGEVRVKVHVHKEDDVLYLIKLVQKYGIKATAEHTMDVFNKEIYELLKANNIPIVYGPIGAVGSKVELKHNSYKNVKALIDSDAEFGLMSDHPVIHAQTLRDSLKYFLIAGMSEVEAMSILTTKNAKILECNDEIGSVEEGKLASLIIWNKDPFHLGAFPKVIIAEGRVIREF